MALRMRLNPSSTSQSRKDYSPESRSSPITRIKRRRFRIKLSSVLATYIKFVSQKLGDGRYAEMGSVESATKKSVFDTASTESASLAPPTQHEEDHRKGDALSQQEPVGMQDLELLKRTAAQQAEMIADESLTHLRFRATAFKISPPGIGF